MRDRPSLNTNITSAPLCLFHRLSSKIFVRTLFAFNGCYVILIEWTFYYFVIRKCLNPNVRVNGTVQFTFFLVIRLNITIATTCDSLFVILVT